MKNEYRTVNFNLETSDEGKLKGYAAVFDSLSEDLGGFREIIKPGAFQRSLETGADIMAYAHHDPSYILGRRSAGTLTLNEDEKGLYVVISPPNTTEAKDLVENVRVGNLKHMSFGFKVVDDTVSMSEDDTLIREVRDLELFEVSIVAQPAYTTTSVNLRDLRDRLPKQPLSKPHYSFKNKILRFILRSIERSK